MENKVRKVTVTTTTIKSYDFSGNLIEESTQENEIKEYFGGIWGNTISSGTIACGGITTLNSCDLKVSDLATNSISKAQLSSIDGGQECTMC